MFSKHMTAVTALNSNSPPRLLIPQVLTMPQAYLVKIRRHFFVILLTKTQGCRSMVFKNL